MRTSSIKFSGLASGLDTDSIVQAMLMPQQSKVDAALQQQKLLELKKDAWKEINTKMLNFQTNTLNKLRLQSSFVKKEATLSEQGIIEIVGNSNISDGTHKIKVKNLAEGAIVNTDAVAGNLKADAKLSELGINETSITITVNGEEKTVELNGDMTLKQLAQKISATGVSANYDENAGMFFVSSTTTGAAQTIAFGGDAETLTKLGISTDLASGKDATIVYNDRTEITSDTNMVSVNGMQIKLLGADANKTITVVTSTNSQGAIDMAKSFVEDYNKLIEEISAKVNAAYNKDYLPLTDEQKSNMSEEDIKLWNEKVEASILRKDPTMQALLTSMRGIISDSKITVMEDGKEKSYSLASFGITTTMNFRDGGKLEIDEEKLSKMVKEKPDVFMQLFTNKVDAKELAGVKEWESSQQQKEYEAKAMQMSGVGTRLYAEFSTMMKGSNISSSNFMFNDKELDTKIQSQKDHVYKLEDRLYRMEKQYYARFTAMEKMLSQLNSQSNSLVSLMGGL